MKKSITSTIILILISISSYSQSIAELVNRINKNDLELGLNEFTGEQATSVYGTTVTIRNRRQGNNDVAANYIKEKFEAMDNIVVTDQSFNTKGRNIIGKQVGKTNPENIYIVCAHYDSVDDYCASDNATGTIAVLEIAKILSKQCFDNTIVYALWDEEEIGLRGSAYYANEAKNNGDTILGVLNIDMMGYDSNGDNKFDIDVRNIAGSLAMKDDLVNVFNSNNFNLEAVIVDPGTTASDHSSFWNQGYPAVLVGESWETGDQSAHWHKASDRTLTLDLSYYTELTKFIMTYMVTKASLLNVDNTVTLSNGTLFSNEASANYQWIDCDTGLEISGATSQSYTPTATGNYAVELTSGTCTEKSICLEVDLLGVNTFSASEINVFPNPVKTVLNIEMKQLNDYSFNLYNTDGKLLLKRESSALQATLNLKDLGQGVYFLKVKTSEKSGTFKIIKK